MSELTIFEGCIKEMYKRTLSISSYMFKLNIFLKYCSGLGGAKRG